MSSSTLTGPYIAESWIHMQQGHGSRKDRTKMLEGRYTKSTASSRSRASSNDPRKSIKELMQHIQDDSGMSRNGIYEAFAQVEDDDASTKTTATTTNNNQAVDIRVRRKSRDEKVKASPRVRAVATATKKPVKESEREPVIRLADALRDSLLVERKLARQELGLSSDKTSHAQLKSPSVRRASSKPNLADRRKSVQQREEPTRQEVITDVKRRLSLGKEKIRDLELQQAKREPRRRTLSSGSILKTAKDEYGRRKSTAAAAESSYMKPTIADMRRRSTTEEQQKEEPLVVLATKRRSALASRKDAQPSSRASSASSGQGTPGSGDDDARKSRRSRGSIHGETASTRTRKKSIVAMDDSSINVRRQRRLSRTESLKEGVPTDPSLNAAMAWRKKSQQDASTTTKSQKGSTTTRKRGKTLPGSLATPPPVQSLNLPPMKVEPIKVNMPKGGRPTSPTRIPKPSRSSALATTPASGTSSEEENTKAAQQASRVKKPNTLAMERRASLKTPRITPASPRDNTGISSATASPRTRPIHTRRPSATSARKLSLSIVNTKNGLHEDASPSIGPSRTRKISTSSMGATTRLYTSNNSSRKNSIASATEHESLVDKEVGIRIERHRAMSLQERLQAMVRQHTENTPIKDSYDMQYPFMRSRHARRSQTYDMENEEESSSTVRSPNRISDSLLWEKEMAEIAAAGIRGPKSPTTAIKYFSAYLSLYERTEIQEYGQIYFVGHQAQKHPATLDQTTCNYGYDDERGDYNIIVKDHLAYRYEVIDVLGRGSFGQVVKCFDHKTGMTVAIKLIRNKKRFHAQAQTEVKILKDLVEWDPQDEHHNIRMTDYFVFRNHLCIACECLSINLYEFIKNNNYRGVSLSLIKRFTIQLLRSLCLLYEHGVIHCDLKPENILLKHPTKSTIKVIDFGSSCFENDRVYTYIQSRFYRSPEVILGMTYNTAIDMWSLGCILAELYTGLPLFPGENEQEQLACIMEVLNVPSRYLIEQSSRRKLFFDSNGNPRIIPNSRGKKRRPGTKTLSHALRCHDAQFLDFVEKCLQWDPEKRMTPDEALCHEWIISRLSKSGNSPVCAEAPNNEDVTKHLAVAHTDEKAK